MKFNSWWEDALKYILRAGDRKVFWCDSKVWLCVCCHRLRALIKRMKLPNLIITRTKRGLYVWSNMKNIRMVLFRVPKNG